MSILSPGRDAIKTVLRTHGPMPAADIDSYLGWYAGRAAKLIHCTRRDHPKQHFRIVKYTKQPSGTRGREIPLYAAEPGDDEPRPTFGRAAARRRDAAYRARRKAERMTTQQVRDHSGKGLIASPWNGLLTVGKSDKTA